MYKNPVEIEIDTKGNNHTPFSYHHLRAHHTNNEQGFAATILEIITVQWGTR